MTYLDVVLETAPVVVDVATETAVVWVDVQAAGGPPGPEGSPGPPGPAGADGADGSVWHEGSGAPPTGLGKIGDFYFNRDTDAVWAKTEAWAGDTVGAWFFQSDLTGAPGPPGPTGPEGPVQTVANVVIDGGGQVITTGVKGAVKITAPSTLTAWEVVSVDNTVGSIVVELWVDTYANWPPVAGDILGSAEKPTLSSQTKNQDTSLNGGAGYPIAGGAWLIWNVASASAVKIVTVALSLART